MNHGQCDKLMFLILAMLLFLNKLRKPFILSFVLFEFMHSTCINQIFCQFKWHIRKLTWK